MIGFGDSTIEFGLGPIKRVLTKITRESTDRWSFSVAVDGEPFASGDGPSYHDAAVAAAGYVGSLTREADQARSDSGTDG